VPVRTTEPGSKYAYPYNVTFNGEEIVTRSVDAECEAARALHLRGISGTITLIDANTRLPRSRVNIEKAAKVTIQETDKVGPRFRQWIPLSERVVQFPGRKQEAA